MKKLIKILFSACVILLYGCTISQYIPNTQNVPIFSEKGTFQTQLSFTNFQASYSLTKHIGVACSFLLKKREGTDGLIHIGPGINGYEPEDERQIKLDEGEINIGYYNRYDNHTVELYIGVGYGKTSYNHHNYADLYGSPTNFYFHFNANPIKIYIQPDFGFLLDPSTEIAVSSKILFYRFTDVSYNISGNINQKEAGKPYDFIPNTNSNDYNFLFFQPAITLREKINYFLKFQIQIGISPCLNKNIIDLNFKKYIFDFGFNLDINKLFQRKK